MGYAPVYAGCHGGSVIIQGGQPGVQPQPPAPKKKIEKLKKGPAGEDETSDTALITITVPADARLLIDGAATVSTSETRTFESPILQVGKSYTYTFTAEFARDGKNVVVTRDVKVQAGAEINVSMNQADAVVASR